MRRTLPSRLTWVSPSSSRFPPARVEPLAEPLEPEPCRSLRARRRDASGRGKLRPAPSRATRSGPDPPHRSGFARQPRQRPHPGNSQLLPHSGRAPGIRSAPRRSGAASAVTSSLATREFRGSMSAAAATTHGPRRPASGRLPAQGLHGRPARPRNPRAAIDPPLELGHAAHVKPRENGPDSRRGPLELPAARASLNSLTSLEMTEVQPQGDPAKENRASELPPERVDGLAEARTGVLFVASPPEVPPGCRAHHLGPAARAQQRQPRADGGSFNRSGRLRGFQTIATPRRSSAATSVVGSPTNALVTTGSQKTDASA